MKLTKRLGMLFFPLAVLLFAACKNLKSSKDEQEKIYIESVESIEEMEEYKKWKYDPKIIADTVPAKNKINQRNIINFPYGKWIVRVHHLDINVIGNFKIKRLDSSYTKCRGTNYPVFGDGQSGYFSKVYTVYVTRFLFDIASVPHGLFKHIKNSDITFEAFFNDGKLISFFVHDNLPDYERKEKEINGIVHFEDVFKKGKRYRKGKYLKENFELIDQVYYPDYPISVTDAQVVFDSIVIGKSYTKSIELISNNRTPVTISYSNKGSFKMSELGDAFPDSFNSVLNPFERKKLFIHFSPVVKDFFELAHQISLNTNQRKQPFLNIAVNPRGGHFTPEEMLNGEPAYVSKEDSILILPPLSDFGQYRMAMKSENRWISIPGTTQSTSRMKPYIFEVKSLSDHIRVGIETCEIEITKEIILK